MIDILVNYNISDSDWHIYLHTYTFMSSTRNQFIISISHSPVKAICKQIGFSTYWIGLSSTLVGLAILSANLKELVYFMVKVCITHEIYDVYTYIMHLCTYYNVCKLISKNSFILWLRKIYIWGTHILVYICIYIYIYTCICEIVYFMC
jgi:hypothetical protein